MSNCHQSHNNWPTHFAWTEQHPYNDTIIEHTVQTFTVKAGKNMWTLYLNMVEPPLNTISSIKCFHELLIRVAQSWEGFVTISCMNSSLQVMPQQVLSLTWPFQNMTFLLFKPLCWWCLCVSCIIVFLHDPTWKKFQVTDHYPCCPGPEAAKQP